MQDQGEGAWFRDDVTSESTLPVLDYLMLGQRQLTVSNACLSGTGSQLGGILVSRV